MKGRRVLGPAIVLIAIGICAAFIDRPVARWFDARFHASPIEQIATSIFVVVDRAIPFAAVAYLIALVWAIARRPSPPLRRIVVAVTASAAALAISLVLKTAIGRSQVYPTFLRDGIYTVHLLRGAPLYGSFPSATMAGAMAFASGLRLPLPVERIVTVIVVILLTTALLVTSGHWVSDIIGGTCLGVLVGPTVANRWPGEPRRPRG